MKLGDDAMKNILIMGVGRAGKTTLSKLLKDKYNSYSLIEKMLTNKKILNIVRIFKEHY